MGSSVSACMDVDMFRSISKPRKQTLLLNEDNGKLTEYYSLKKDVMTLLQTETTNSESTNPTISIETKITEVNDEMSKLIDLNIVLQQVFVSCELGDVSEVQSTFATYPELKSLINDTRQCFLLENKLDITLLHLSCAHGHVDIVNLLLESCPTIDVNQADNTYLMTALHFAVSMHRHDTVRELLSRPRVSANERNIDGKSPLHLAIEYGYPDIVETFLKTRPNVDLRFKDFDGNNVIHLAAYHPSFAVMKLFVDHVSLIQSYNDYFEINETSTSSRHVQLLEAINYSHENPLEILRNAIEMIQKRTHFTSSDGSATAHDGTESDSGPKASHSSTATTGQFKELVEKHHDSEDLLTEAVNSFIYLSDAIRVLSPVGLLSLTTFGNHSPSSSSLNSFAESEAFQYSRYRGDSSRDVSCSWSPQQETSYISVSKKLNS